MKTFLALLVAALAGATLLTLACAPYLGSLEDIVSNVAFVAWLVAFIFIALAAFTIGLLLHTAATRTKRVALWYYFAGSALIGAALSAWQMEPMLSLLSQTESWSVFPRLGIFALGAGVGAVMGISFWLIRRPDRDAAPNPPTSPP